MQNQTGNHPKWWEKTGRIIETLCNRQYQVRVDGSNRVTLHKRRFLKKVSPVADQIQPLLPPTQWSGPSPPQNCWYASSPHSSYSNANHHSHPAFTASSTNSHAAWDKWAWHHQPYTSATQHPARANATGRSLWWAQPLSTDYQHHHRPKGQFNSCPQGTVSEKATGEILLCWSKRTPRPKCSLSLSMYGQHYHFVEQNPSQPPDLPEVSREERACRVEHIPVDFISCCHLVSASFVADSILSDTVRTYVWTFPYYIAYNSIM